MYHVVTILCSDWLIDWYITCGAKLESLLSLHDVIPLLLQLEELLLEQHEGLREVVSLK